KRLMPEGIWTKCPKCEETIYRKELEAKLNVCAQCGYHFPLSAWGRVASLMDGDSFQQMDEDMRSVDILSFPGYLGKLEANQQKTGLRDAVITGTGKLHGRTIALGVMDFGFNGGSMGSVVGEKLTRVIEKATQDGIPVIICSTSGGARMYEGMFSLMQMAKTCGALAYHGRKKLPFISVLTDPTMAGVMASFASVGDLILAEPGARIGFAGPRVIKDTTKAELPPGFQTAEFLRDHGLIDAIVPRKELKGRLACYLDFMMTGQESGLA
ncbi:MAG: acetyl-CoA carboxylase, carboxyltransferase subunit beta, partial [Verrucomicrobiota bacterium]|nr:acetyl-CoA carboxylase, carboxyltransferase subunit beta [Verrucomicrobiota bacterium]